MNSEKHVKFRNSQTKFKRTLQNSRIFGNIFAFFLFHWFKFRRFFWFSHKKLEKKLKKRRPIYIQGYMPVHVFLLERFSKHGKTGNNVPFLLLLCQRKLLLPIYFEMFFLGFNFLLAAWSKKHFDSWPHKFWQKPRFCSFFFLATKMERRKQLQSFEGFCLDFVLFNFFFPTGATATMVDFLFLLSPNVTDNW